MGRNQPRRKGPGHARTLRLLLARTARRQLLAHPVPWRLGQGRPARRGTAQLRHQGARHQARCARPSISHPRLPALQERPSPRRRRRSLWRHARLVRQLPVRLRCGPRRQITRAHRHQPLQLGLPPPAPCGLYHAQNVLELERRRQRPDQPQFSSLGPPLYSARPRPAPPRAPEQLGNHRLQLQRTETHRPARHRARSRRRSFPPR